MKTFKIPVTWEVYGTVRIEANSLDEAIAKFDKESDMIPLPTDHVDYVDGSFRREDEETIKLNNTEL
jgi:hypothetical protein